jgi:hypothetical protein
MMRAKCRPVRKCSSLNRTRRRHARSDLFCSACFVREYSRFKSRTLLTKRPDGGKRESLNQEPETHVRATRGSRDSL